MRKKAERQLPLDFAGTQKLTQEWYKLYRNIHEILEANPAVLDLVHADLTQGERKLKRNIEGVASESILRVSKASSCGLTRRRWRQTSIIQWTRRCYATVCGCCRGC